LTTEERYRRILSNHLPPQAVDWVYGYLDRYKIHFHITRGRATKLGDYRWPQGEHPYHEISINGDLNPYLFLWVFLHEAAHLETHQRYAHSSPAPPPHGHEWQGEYAQLIIAHATFFPDEVQPLLKRYTRRIPLNRSVLRQIEETLHHYDPGYSDTPHLVLDDLPTGSTFRLTNKPDLCFVSLERRRTRWLCREVATGRTYTVNGRAEVGGAERPV